MSQERDQARTHIAPSAPTHDDDLAPGRGSRSSRMDAPARPITGGLIQRKARDAKGVAEGADAAVSAASSSGGSPLPAPLMRKFESSLGAELSSVRVHTGGESAHAAQAVGARAYTMGQDIHFGAGQYDLSSEGGQHLLAHEVAHTVQQRGGSPTRQNKLEVSSPGDAAELEADRAADAMMIGAPVDIAASGRQLARENDGSAGESPTTQSKDPADPKVPFAMSAPVEEAPAHNAVNPVKVTVKVNGPHGPTSQEGMAQAAALRFDSPDYATLYSKISERELTGKEAGFERPNLSGTFKTERPNANSPEIVVGANYTMDLEIGLPEWTTKAKQPQADQQKFDRWRAGVERHEKAHAFQDQRGLARRLKEAIRGPSIEEAESQQEAVTNKVQEFQDAVDFLAQPPPLEAPGGTTKVP